MKSLVPQDPLRAAGGHLVWPTRPQAAAGAGRVWPGDDDDDDDDDNDDDDDDDVLQLLASLSYGLNYVFLRFLSWRLLYLELVNDVCGTYVSYYIAEYSFITDISPVEQRSAAQSELRTK